MCGRKGNIGEKRGVRTADQYRLHSAVQEVLGRYSACSVSSEDGRMEVHPEWGRFSHPLKLCLWAFPDIKVGFPRCLPCPKCFLSAGLL